MTRGGIDALRAQIWAQASRHGRTTAQDVLIVTDGAVWIWKLGEDRFLHARQRLDAYHAKQHLRVVADTLHGAGSPAARAWVTPLRAKFDKGKPLEKMALRACLGNNAQALSHMKMQARETIAAKVRWSFS